MRSNGAFFVGLFFLLAGAFFAPIAPAFSSNYSIEFVVELAPNGTARLVSYSPAPPTSPIGNSKGEYYAVLESKGAKVSDANFSAEFLLLTEPPIETDIANAVLVLSAGNSLPDSFKIFSPEGRLILSEGISVCTVDSSCSAPSENYLSCPSDCPLGKRDLLCEPDSPICDPDCETGADSDCRGIHGKEGEGKTNPAVFGALLFGIFAFLVYYLHSWKNSRL